MGYPKGTPTPPVPPRRQGVFRTVSRDLLERFRAQDPAAVADLLRTVDMEHRRAPMDNSAQPYIDALRMLEEEQPGRATKILEAAGNPEALMPAIREITEEDFDTAAATGDLSALTSSINDERFAGLQPYQREALAEVVDLLGAYQRAEAEALSRYAQMTPEQQAQAVARSGDAAVAFSTSRMAQDMRQQLEDILLTNDMVGMLQYDPDVPLSQMLANIAPSIGDLPASDRKPRYWSSRADHPEGNKLSTYMGRNKRDQDFYLDDELTGGQAGQLRRLAGPQMREILELAGWPREAIYGRRGPRPVPGMSDETVMRLLQEFQQPGSQTTRVRGPDGTVREIGLGRIRNQGVKPSRGERLDKVEADLASLQTLDNPPRSRIQELLQLRERLMQGPMRAPGDSPVAARKMREQITELAGLPLDESADLADHVIDNRLVLTEQEVNNLPMELREAYLRGEISRLDQLQDRELSQYRLGSISTAPSPDDVRNYTGLVRAEDGGLIRPADAAAPPSDWPATQARAPSPTPPTFMGVTPFDSVSEAVAVRRAMEPPRFVEGGPTAFRDQATKDNAIGLLRRRLAEMQARMKAGRAPGAIEREPVPRMTLTGPDPNSQRSPRQKEMEQWLQAGGQSTSVNETLTVDPVTGQRMFAEDSPYFQTADQIKKTPPLPSFLYAIPPEVDAAGNVTHPRKPMDPVTASNTFAYTLGAETPDFAESIRPVMEAALRDQWESPPASRTGEDGRPVRGGNVFRIDKRTGEEIRERMFPNETGLKFLASRQGGGVAGGLNLGQPQPRNRAPAVESPSLEDLENMPLGEMGDTPAPSPDGDPQKSFDDWVNSMMDPAGDMPPAAPPPRPPAVDDINSMFDEIPLDDDETGFLGSGAMNMMRGQPLLANLLV